MSTPPMTDVVTYTTNTNQKFNPLPTHWVGDFDPTDHRGTGTGLPNRFYPPVPLLPHDYYPPLIGIEWTGSSNSTIVVSPWRKKLVGDVLTLSVDVPGAAAADLDVNINNNMISVTGKRPDTNGSIFHTYTLDGTYDASTADAVLSSGVLAISFTKIKQNQAKRSSSRKNRPVHLN